MQLDHAVAFMISFLSIRRDRDRGNCIRRAAGKDIMIVAMTLKPKVAVSPILYIQRFLEVALFPIVTETLSLVSSFRGLVDGRKLLAII
jgi:hypothetical protein